MNSIQFIIASPVDAGLPNSLIGLVMMLLFGAAGLVSLPLAVANPVLISSLNVSTRFKAMNFICWGVSLIPLIVSIYHLIMTPNAIIGPNWMFVLNAYQYAFPIVTISQFFLLRRKWRNGPVRYPIVLQENRRATKPTHGQNSPGFQSPVIVDQHMPDAAPEYDYRGCGCLSVLIPLTIATVLPFVYMVVTGVPFLLKNNGHAYGHADSIVVALLLGSFWLNIPTIAGWCLYVFLLRRSRAEDENMDALDDEE